MSAAGGAHTLPVRLSGPLDAPASLEGLRRYGDDGLDRWDGVTLLRTVRLADRTVAYAVRFGGSPARPLARATVEDAGDAAAVRATVQQTFVGDGGTLAALAEVDPVVARLWARHPGVRPLRQPDLFTALVRSITAQQVNLRWATTTRRRLAEAFGERVAVAGQPVYRLDPQRLAACDPAEIRALQLTTAKARAVVGVARAMVGGDLDTAWLAALPDAEAVAELVRLPGIGPWTADWILARTLGRPRVVAGDLGVRRAIGLAYLGGRMPAEPEARAAVAHWGPAAAAAQGLLLHALVAGTLAPGSGASGRE